MKNVGAPNCIIIERHEAQNGVDGNGEKGNIIHVTRVNMKNIPSETQPEPKFQRFNRNISLWFPSFIMP